MALYCTEIIPLSSSIAWNCLLLLELSVNCQVHFNSNKRPISPKLVTISTITIQARIQPPIPHFLIYETLTIQSEVLCYLKNM